jgi:hypothetical protein
VIGWQESPEEVAEDEECGRLGMDSVVTDTQFLMLNQEPDLEKDSRFSRSATAPSFKRHSTKATASIRPSPTANVI